jgi:hypothetical protein
MLGCRGAPHHPWSRAGRPCDDELLGEIPRTQGQRVPFSQEKPVSGSPRKDSSRGAWCDPRQPSEQSYANNTTGITPTLVGEGYIYIQWLDWSSSLLFVCMILPGGGRRLQTFGGLAAQLFDSTLRTLLSDGDYDEGVVMNTVTILVCLLLVLLFSLLVSPLLSSHCIRRLSLVMVQHAYRSLQCTVLAADYR